MRLTAVVLLRAYISEHIVLHIDTASGRGVQRGGECDPTLVFPLDCVGDDDY